MAMSRAVHILSKQEEMQNYLCEAEKKIIVLRKLLCRLRKNQFGKLSDLVRHRIPQNHIRDMLQVYQQVDSMLLELQNLVDQCANFSMYLQNQLTLEIDHTVVKD